VKEEFVCQQDQGNEGKDASDNTEHVVRQHLFQLGLASQRADAGSISWSEPNCSIYRQVWLCYIFYVQRPESMALQIKVDLVLAPILSDEWDYSQTSTI
jgi:hypothetical protein